MTYLCWQERHEWANTIITLSGNVHPREPAIPAATCHVPSVSSNRNPNLTSTLDIFDGEEISIRFFSISIVISCLTSRYQHSYKTDKNRSSFSSYRRQWYVLVLLSNVILLWEILHLPGKRDLGLLGTVSKVLKFNVQTQHNMQNVQTSVCMLRNWLPTNNPR